MDNVKVEWVGMKKVLKMTKDMERAFTPAMQRSTLRYSLTDMRKQMRLNLPPNKTGALWFATDIDVVRDGYDALGSPVFSGYVGPRRQRGNRKKQGWHAYVIELGTKPHTIRSKSGKPMPVYRRGKLLGMFNAIEHSGAKAFKPFSKALVSEMGGVAKRMVEKYAFIMRKTIQKNK